MSLTSTVTAKITATATTPYDMGTPTFTLDQTYFPTINLANGTGAGQADVIFTDERTLAISATENLDLAGGTLTNPFGTVLTMVTVKVIYIRAEATNVNDVLVGGGGATAIAGIFGDGATDVIKVKPGGAFLWIAPKIGAPVAATTADILKVANGGAGTAVTYEVVIIGTSV